MSQYTPRRRRPEDDSGGFSGELLRNPPPVPPALLRRIGGKELTGIGKVKVMLKVTGSSTDDSSLRVDRKHKQVALTDPAATSGSLPQDRRVGVAASKMFAFDAIFTDEDSQADINSSALVDVLHAVINGNDGCLLCFGHARLGKSHTMIGSPSCESMGVIPSAISWLFRAISEQKLRTGSRFSVRVSAIEVSSSIKDLLLLHANDCEQSPGVFLRDPDQNYSELRVASAEKAAYYLDSALAGRSQQAHFLFTLHIYQYNVASKGAVAGGRSRLHLLDLGTCDRTKGLSLSSVGNVLLAIFNGQRHPPHREYKLTQVLRDCLSSLTCHVTLLAHVSPSSFLYSETLGTVQLAARIHRIRRRRVKFGNSAATQVAGEDLGRVTGSSDVDPSSSEQSADTVIYVGRSEETDGEHPPVYLPSLTSGDNRCVMSKVLRGSGMEAKGVAGVKQSASRSMPCSPQRVPETSGNTEKKSSYGKQPSTNSAKSSPAKTNLMKDTKHSEPKQLEERWVDGPKIAKSKVVEARHLNLLHKSRQHLMSKKETWIDGPLKSNQETYGFMDYHKKSMIKKWLENQSLLHQRHKSSCREKGSRGYLTRFKTCGGEKRTEAEGKSKSSSSSSKEEPLKSIKPIVGEQKDEAYERFKAVRGQPSGQEDGEGEEDSKVVAPLAQTTTAQNGDISRVQRIQETPCIDEDDDEDLEVEIVEVEEEESVLMQDSCLQVTEEDIALCMGRLVENPLPEVDQTREQNMKQANLTLVSTFTDSVSVAYDFERLITQSVQNLPSGSPWVGNKNRVPLFHSPRGVLDYSQLSRLSMAGALDASCMDLQNRPLARCQSLSLTDMLGQPLNTPSEHLSDTDNNSIVSEPAYTTGGDQLSDKLCDKCRLRFNSSDLYETPLYANLRSLSSLRHPDGASNPNLKQAGDGEKENVTPGPGTGRRSEEDSDEDPAAAVPPPLHPLLTLTRDTFSRAKGVKLGLTGVGGNQSQFSVHDPGGTGMQYCKADVERLERLRDARSPLLTPNSRWHAERETKGRTSLVGLRENSCPASSTLTQDHNTPDRSQ